MSEKNHKKESFIIIHICIKTPLIHFLPKAPTDGTRKELPKSQPTAAKWSHPPSFKQVVQKALKAP